MRKISSKIKSGLQWQIKTKNDITEDEKNFIEYFNPQIYHNDLTGKLWAFDEKLPSGRWLENITINNEITIAKALIL